jgi:hypothetical protein
MKSLALFAIALLFATSCQYDPYAGDMTTVKPKFSQAVGLYQFDSQTFGSESLNKDLKASYIILNKDSTFKAVNVPMVTYDKYNGTVSGNGKWHIEVIGGIGGGKEIKDEWGIYLDGLPEYVKYVGFVGEHFPYNLMITYGDPDEGAIAIFKRKK